MKKISYALTITIAMFSFKAFAGQYNNVIIDHITVEDTGVARILAVDGAMVSETQCHQTNSESTAYFAFDVTTAVGKSWQSMILTALATGKKTHLIGTGNCISWQGISYENLRIIYSLK